MRRLAHLLALPLPFLLLAACDSNDDPDPTTFVVTVENVSTPNIINSARAGGTVPLSPGVWAVFTGNDPLFTVGQPADAGTEMVAEDGVLDGELASVASLARVSASGTFTAPGGPDAGPALFAGESATFTFTAERGDRLQFEAMFVQSNDWFYAFSGGGLALFDGDTPVTGDVTSRLGLYDAGTEEDTAPGTGPDQKPAQTMDNQGPDDDDPNVRTAGGFTIPPAASIIRVTIAVQ